MLAEAPPLLRLGRTYYVEGSLPVLLVSRLEEGLVVVDTGNSRITLPGCLLTAECGSAAPAPPVGGGR